MNGAYGRSRRFAWLEKDNVIGYVFLAPFLIFLFLFMILPIFQGLYMSFFDWNALTPPAFVGLGNFQTMFGEVDFWSSLWHTVYFVIISTLPLVGLGLAIALGLNRSFRGKTIARGLFFFPYLLTVSVVATIWRWVLQEHFGLLNYYLGKLGAASLKWLGDPNLAMISIALATLWWTVGFNVVVFLAALQEIPEQLYEAARIDGATPWQLFRHITLPQLQTSLTFVFITQIIASFQVFGQVNVMTGGGPFGSTRTLVQYIYEQGFKYLKMGYASAVAYLLFAIMFVCTALQWKLFSNDNDE
ncbi:multiple sugar transport system permease protein [Hydrogenispora ethanolica]|jgi:multiple sugar transport system permease protein|uniref:Multiple sugar transport system permease protein n=1 Tax=Hydrogenispora ethanolica TaxID=1082276 RepID=A0A4R1R0I0_HYDET|nr:sugar ABC transporter permease [Hydrogenispora ethanolica]TCL58813.1 multiple sugar transport system permease protein [Hydrogenispora ethanolica]